MGKKRQTWFWALLGLGALGVLLLTRRRGEAAPSPEPFLPPTSPLVPISPPTSMIIPTTEPTLAPIPLSALWKVGQRVIDSKGRLGTVQHVYGTLPAQYFVYFDSGDKEIVLETNLSPPPTPTDTTLPYHVGQVFTDTSGSTYTITEVVGLGLYLATLVDSTTGVRFTNVPMSEFQLDNILRLGGRVM